MKNQSYYYSNILRKPSLNTHNWLKHSVDAARNDINSEQWKTDKRFLYLEQPNNFNLQMEIKAKHFCDFFSVSAPQLLDKPTWRPWIYAIPDV